MENKRQIDKLFKKNPATLKTIFHEIAEAGAIPVLYRFRDYIQGPIAPYLQEKDKYGDLCIHLAVKSHRGTKAIQILTVLAELGADLNAMNNDTHFTVLHLATMGSDHKLVRWLAVQPQIDLNAKSWDGLTAYEMAFIGVDQLIMDILTFHGAEATTRGILRFATAFPNMDK